MSLDKSEREWQGVVAVAFALQQAFVRLETVVNFLLFLGKLSLDQYVLVSCTIYYGLLISFKIFVF